MHFKRSGWRIYLEQMSQLDHGDALWEPAPIHSFKRIQLGDVGYVRRGRFHLLFSAGCPLGERQLGIDVPLTFKPLNVGPVVRGQPRLPGHISTNTVRETGVGLGASMSPVPMLEPGVSIAFELTEKQGAALVTKYRTYKEDVELEFPFKAYTKRHYDSWVSFARDAGHGDDIKPVLVTGVDMTRDFAMMAYANSGVSLASEFTTSVPMIASASASAWGTWRTEGLVHTNCGPQTCCPPSPTLTTDLAPSGDIETETVPDQYNQCVFVRYYTMRKRALMFPRVIRAAAGPHDLGPGGCDDEGSPEVEAPFDSDSDSDVASNFWDGDGEDDRSSVTSIDSESDIVVHNTASDEGDDFDLVADYIFQNSDAESVLIHHRDIALLRESGGSADIPTLLLEKRPRITVDGSGVGTIDNQTGPARETLQSNPMSGEPTSTFPPFDIRGGDIPSPDGSAPYLQASPLSVTRVPPTPLTGRSDHDTLPQQNAHKSALLQRDVLSGDTQIDMDSGGTWFDIRRDIPQWIHKVAEEFDPGSTSNQLAEEHVRHAPPPPSPTTSPRPQLDPQLFNSDGSHLGISLGPFTSMSAPGAGGSLESVETHLDLLGFIPPAFYDGFPCQIFQGSHRPQAFDHHPFVWMNDSRSPVTEYQLGSTLTPRTATRCTSLLRKMTLSPEDDSFYSLCSEYLTMLDGPTSEMGHSVASREAQATLVSPFTSTNYPTPHLFHSSNLRVSPGSTTNESHHTTQGNRRGYALNAPQVLEGWRISLHSVRLGGAVDPTPTPVRSEAIPPSLSSELTADAEFQSLGHGNWSQEILTEDFGVVHHLLGRSQLARRLETAVGSLTEGDPRTAMDPDEGLSHFVTVVGLLHVVFDPWRRHLRLNPLTSLILNEQYTHWVDRDHALRSEPSSSRRIQSNRTPKGSGRNTVAISVTLWSARSSSPAETGVDERPGRGVGRIGAVTGNESYRSGRE